MRIFLLTTTDALVVSVFYCKHRGHMTDTYCKWHRFPQGSHSTTLGLRKCAM